MCHLHIIKLKLLFVDASLEIITGPPNGPVLFCWLSSVVIVCNAARLQAGTLGRYSCIPLGRHLVLL